MEKTYVPSKTESQIYTMWEEGGYFKPEIHPQGKPYCIILPPPNANAPLHFGHAAYVIEDILVRYHRMKQEAVLWLPGADHAGFETQFVFEKHLHKEGKSRFDYSREELYKMIWAFVENNRPVMEGQLRALGFSLDWSRLTFTLDPRIVAIVYQTFKKLADDKMLYRKKRLINYCTYDGTSFSDLEVVHEEKESTLYTFNYPLVSVKGYIPIATTRPETLVGDSAIMVHPKDKRYLRYVGEFARVPFVDRDIPVIADEKVDMSFGTGAVKVTPAHDPIDYEVGQRHNLESITVIGFDGKMNRNAGPYEGMYSKQARKQIVKDLLEKKLLVEEKRFSHTVPVCYKCKNHIEPLLREQWFISVKSLALQAKEAVTKEKIHIYPQRFVTQYTQFLDSIRDWNISRQVVWGIRIPAWQCNACSFWIVTSGDTPTQCNECKSTDLMQDEDTFDTWFSSSQWPFVTLMTNQKKDFETFYPTSVMETGYDILPWWVARMVMMGIYITKKVPFKDIVLHGLVNDPYGKKMSKSKGNVVNPLELVNEYGADAVRFALIYESALGNDQSLSYGKLEAAKKFGNKLWNMARFFHSLQEKYPSIKKSSHASNFSQDTTMQDRVKKLTEEITKCLDQYQFHLGAEELYTFIWHEFADKYIEDVKKRMETEENKDEIFTVALNTFLILITLLHPFMPFITEAIFQSFSSWHKGGVLITTKWPENMTI